MERGVSKAELRDVKISQSTPKGEQITYDRIKLIVSESIVVVDSCHELE